MKAIDYFLDRITMYRLLLYYLLILLGVSVVLGAFGTLPYTPKDIVVSAAYLTLLCWLINKLLAWIFKAPSNPESSLITALILALIITPHFSGSNIIFLTAAAILAMASKYILTIRRQHIFNPAAIAVVLTSFGAQQAASWWVGNPSLIWLVIIGGLLVIRKINRIQMVGLFLVTAVLAAGAIALLNGSDADWTIRNMILHSSLFFMAFVMLTEPLTSPTRFRQQGAYALLAGALFSPQIHLFGIYSTPELVLVISNAFSYIISPRLRLSPRLTEQLDWGSTVKDFIFQAGHKFNYQPGQYMEWTLPHHKVDSRGSRRYFTLASSPTEDNLRLGIKFYTKGSSFKRAMLKMDAKTPIAAGQLGGDFVLPNDGDRKLAFIAGGIGITPFRSMLKYLVDTHDKRSVTLLYAESNSANLAYQDVLAEAEQHGAKIVYAISGKSSSQSDLPGTVRLQRITPQLIKQEVPDYQERLFYISGSHNLVNAMKADLRALGVPNHHIKTDFFPGYV